MGTARVREGSQNGTSWEGTAWEVGAERDVADECGESGWAGLGLVGVVGDDLCREVSTWIVRRELEWVGLERVVRDDVGRTGSDGRLGSDWCVSGRVVRDGRGRDWSGLVRQGRGRTD